MRVAILGAGNAGCAVAADTGTALLQNVIDIDLFYDTYLESYLNGRKICDVYILD